MINHPEEYFKKASQTTTEKKLKTDETIYANLDLNDDNPLFRQKDIRLKEPISIKVKLFDDSMNTEIVQISTIHDYRVLFVLNNKEIPRIIKSGDSLDIKCDYLSNKAIYPEPEIHDGKVNRIKLNPNSTESVSNSKADS